MLIIPRELARRVRTLARKCAGRTRGPAPPVRITVTSDAIELFLDLGACAVAGCAPTMGGDAGTVAVPITALEPADGPGAGPLELDADAGHLRWIERGVPRERPVTLLSPTDWPVPPVPPARWAKLPGTFLTALHEAGRTAARQPGRYAWHCLQLQGKAGRVVATDGGRALVQSGFPFPFADDLLVPALPVFGSKELQSPEVRVGRAGDCVVLAGPWWTVWLRVHAGGRFPDVAGVLPRTRSSDTVVTLADADAQRLALRLPGLPGASDEHTPVTLVVSAGMVSVRSRDAAGGPAVELGLDQSSTHGPDLVLPINRDFLARALALGFQTFRCPGPDKPLVAADDTRAYLTAPLDPTAAVTTDAERIAPEELPMKIESNGRPEPPAGEPSDPLAEAEALRDALATADRHLGRLVAALKARRKEQRALSQVYSSLKSLNLSP